MKPIDLADGNTEGFLFICGLLVMAVVFRLLKHRERMAGKYPEECDCDKSEQTIRRNPEFDDERS